jgi:hypothetical protein
MSEFPPEDLPEWSAEERALWNSALDDRPPSRSLSTTLQAVGVASAITAAASGAGAGVVAKAGTGLALFKWGAIVGLGGAVAVGGGVMARRSSAPAEKPQPVAAAAPTAARAGPPRTEEPRPLPQTAENPLPRSAPRAPASSGRIAATARSSGAAASQPDIAEEIQNIDSARTLIRQGRTKEALAALDRSKNKSLGVEATVLRIEALMRQGDRARATALANSFLAAHPKSPYAARIRALLRKSEP